MHDTTLLEAPASGRTSRLVAAFLRRLLLRYSFSVALLLMLVLLIANLLQTSHFAWSTQLANFAPVAIAAMASTPAIISGGGGFDLSISPVMILTTGVYIIWLV